MKKKKPESNMPCTNVNPPPFEVIKVKKKRKKIKK